MRKIITTTFVTLDGVMQAPGGREEDREDGFAYGGWQGNAAGWDEMMNNTMNAWMGLPFELLLGKRTYDIFAPYWPTQKGFPIAEKFNSSKKYVVSRTLAELSWKNSKLITGDDVVAQIKNLKEEDGPDLWVYGSGNLIQTLLEHHLIDRMHLWIYPITIGTGKRLFAQGTQAEHWKLVDSKISTSGVIVGTYEPAGPLAPQK